MLRILAAACAITLLAACSIFRVSDMGPEELRQVSVPALCTPFASGPAVQAERARRGLSDCSTPDWQCVQAGYRAGTKEYNDCRYGTPEQQAQARFRQCVMSSAAAFPGDFATQMSKAQLLCSGRATYAELNPSGSTTQKLVCMPFGAGVMCTAQ